jgi:segregation and condensation protein A
MSFEVKLAQFEGPLDLLLDLIEKERLNISEISLARVTDAYLQYVEGHHEIPPEELADFLVVASKLLLIKSQALLPFLTMSEPEAEGDLEAQLKIYKEYLEASKLIEAAIGSKRFLYVHEKLPSVEIGFAPPKKLATGDMANFMRAVIARLQPVFVVPQATVERLVSIHEKIRRIHEWVKKAERLSFREVLLEAESRVDVVVTFLALLELVKQRNITVTQEGQFDDIVINATHGENPA